MSVVPAVLIEGTSQWAAGIHRHGFFGPFGSVLGWILAAQIRRPQEIPVAPSGSRAGQVFRHVRTPLRIPDLARWQFFYRSHASAYS